MPYNSTPPSPLRSTLRRVAIAAARLALPLALLPAFWPSNAAAQSCDDPTSTAFALIADQVYDIGCVAVRREDQNLRLTYIVEEADWCVAATNLHVALDPADIPQNKHGDPVTGRFDHKSRQRSCPSIYGITVGLGDWVLGTELFIAAHADVIGPGGAGKKIDAWAGDIPFASRIWSRYFQYSVSAPACGGQAACTVFVTRDTFYGVLLGGLDGADEICEQSALAAGLDGEYKAWLSTASSSAADRLSHAEVPYVQPGDVQIADNWVDLTTSEFLDAPFERDEFGVPVAGGERVATGTFPDGSWSGGDCGAWGMEPPSTLTSYGITRQQSGTWSWYYDGVCEAGHLYCFQQ